MIFIGYEGRPKAYRVYDPSSWRVHVTRDVVFDEGASWDWYARGRGEQNDHDDFSVEYSVELIGGDAPAPVPPDGLGGHLKHCSQLISPSASEAEATQAVRPAADGQMAGREFGGGGRSGDRREVPGIGTLGQLGGVETTLVPACLAEHDGARMGLTAGVVAERSSAAA
ncbi:hypothetical protein E2562_024767 [Oryza meyeriana var. granulata]|uniref:Retroviral polymerase SH3-like domain-containing protein n=1 Tax=Oryza meyeriana var. granulata TaxID=110450 RepID=A0A6G1FBJ1_9ORYZ|nr:hypothetical protein E2562_024767 [Oryza meyeriana var. granulata]